MEDENGNTIIAEIIDGDVVAPIDGTSPDVIVER